MTTVYRERMAQPGDERHMHAGEAETVAVIVGRELQRTAIFISDDRGALGLAASQGMRVADTWDLMALAERVGFCTAGERSEFERILAQKGRRRPRREG